MSASDLTIERTILPADASTATGADGQRELRQLREAMAHTSDKAKLEIVDQNAEPVVLPEAIYDLVEYAVKALAAGMPVQINARRPSMLSTSQAAEIVGVSRATMVRFLEDGRLPFSQPGKHRRIRLEDVLKFKEEITHARYGATQDVHAITSEIFDEESRDGR